MELTKFLWDRFWDFLEGMNIYMGCFIIRWGLWMLIASGLLYLAWIRLHSRTRFTQILTFIVSTTVVYVLPLEHLARSRPVYGAFILVCFLAMVCLPSRVAFFLTPILGQQLKITWGIYGLEILLFLVQLRLM